MIPREVEPNGRGSKSVGFLFLLTTKKPKK